MPSKAAYNRFVTACGALGPVMLLAYFTLPFLEAPLARVLYASQPTNAAVVEAGRRYHELIYAGTWLQATGALLMVVFLLTLVDAARGTHRVIPSVVQVGCAVLLAVVLAEGLCSLAWATAAQNGQTTSSVVAFDLGAPFARIYPLIAVPIISVGLGYLLSDCDVLPRAFARLSLVLGVGFVLAGFVGVMVPAAAGVAGALGSLQALWILAAAIAFRRTHRELPNSVRLRLDARALSNS